MILSGGLTSENVADGDRGRASRGASTWRAASRRRRASRTRRSSRRSSRPSATLAGRREAARLVSPDGSDVTAIEHRFGPYGGQYVPETLVPALVELEAAWLAARDDPTYQAELTALLNDYVGRPSPLYLAQRLSEDVGHPVYLKREDLNHTGAHKINNALGQALLAKRMGKTRIIAETGAGSHGVAIATACALLGLDCYVYMGTEDMRRQAPNVQRMGLLGTTVMPVDAGARTLKEAVSAAIRDWVANVGTTHYAIGSCVGPAPFPALVRDLQRIIGDEARAQILEKTGALPSRVIACVGGGSNAIGTFVPFLAGPGRDRRRRGRGGGDRVRPPRRAADRRRPRRRPARRLQRDHAGRGRPDPRGALDLRRPGLSRHRPRARLPARHRPRALRRRHRRPGAGARSRGSPRWRASSRRSSPRTPSPGCSATQAPAETVDLICLSGRGDKDLAEALDKLGARVSGRDRRGPDRGRVRHREGPRGADAVPDGRLPGHRDLGGRRHGLRRVRGRPRRARRPVQRPARRRAGDPRRGHQGAGRRAPRCTRCSRRASGSRSCCRWC